MTGFRYQGETRHGTRVTGAADEYGSAADLVEAKFTARWPWLEVEDDAGELVGEIYDHPDTGARSWWGDDQ